MKLDAEFVNGELVIRIPVRPEIIYLKTADAVRERLSPAEWKVFLKLRDGYVAKEIAGSLNVCVRTVKFHMSNIYRKLNCTTYAEFIYKFGTRNNEGGEL